MNLYISNLNYAVTSDALSDLFSQFGEVSSAAVITDKRSGRSRGYGFVEMANEVDAKNAIENLNDKIFEGRSLRVVPAKSSRNNK